MVDSEQQPEFLTVRETAQRLAVHENTVRNWAKSGYLRSARLPGSRAHRFDAAEVERLARTRGAVVSGIDVGRRMVGPELIDATQLDAFADRIESRGLLPQLVRRLLAATPGVQDLSMRAGEGIASPGWDGLANATSGTPWVPAGQSAWELGTGKSPRAKAQLDYEKRTADPLGVDREQTTFVFVTLRRWGGARASEAELRSLEQWRNVRILDADDLEAWLDATPAVHHWISEQLGMQPQGAQTLSAWWQNFTGRTRPPLPRGLFLAGRDREAIELREFLDRAPAAVGVQAKWREEALGFIGAVFEADDADKGQADRPALVVLNRDVWHRLALIDAPMVLIPLFDSPDISTALAHQHHVVIPLGAQEAGRGAVIELPPLHREQAQAAFTDAGVEFREADRLAGLARRSMASLVRDRSLDPRISKPRWAERPASDVIAPLMLVGAWSESDADHDIIAEIVGKQWPDIEQELVAQGTTDDPPFVQSGGRWHLTAPEEAFAVLHQLLTAAALDRWCGAVSKVLGETDSTLDLSNEDQMMASMTGRRLAYSGALREGLAQSLALVGAMGKQQVGGGPTMTDRVKTVVRSLLERANQDMTGLLWRSISALLPRLAEAAPAAFLDAIEVGTSGDTPILATMFRDGDDSSWLYGSSPHTGLLWALEVLCWSQQYLDRASDALGRLAEIDPGGRLANRPPASLRAVFLPWIPYTSAPLEKRLEALSHLQGRYPTLGWDLLLSLLPRQHDSSSPTSEPRFRDWKPDRKGVSLSEWSATIDGLIAQLLQLAGNDPVRWASVVSHLSSLSPAHRIQLLDHLEKVVARPDALEPQGRLELWRHLVDEVARHRRFSSAKWAMDEATLQQLDGFASQVEPPLTVERHARLFEWRPDLPDVDPLDHVAYDRALAAKQAAVVSEVLGQAGIDGLLRLARSSKRPEVVGWTSADIAGDDLTPGVLPLLDSDDAEGRFARTWATRMAIKEGADWIAATWSALSSTTLQAKTSFLLAMPPGDDLRHLLSKADESTQESFWQSVDPWKFSAEDPNFAVAQLLSYDRPWIAISLLTSYVHNSERATAGLTPELVERVLRAALTSESRDGVRSQTLGYEIGLLLDYIERENVDSATLAELEWAYFPALNHEREAKALYTQLAHEPSRFVDLVTAAFRGTNERRRQLDEQGASYARNAYEVLSKWRRAPGLDDNRVIDPTTLTEWVKKARLLLAERDRADIGDELIGQLLSGSPEGSDAIWPAEPVRELIENIGSQQLEAGMHIGRLNARGVTSRGMYDGGQQERALAIKYHDWASKASPRWPRTARMLRGLSESYERDAQRNDAEADLRQNED